MNGQRPRPFRSRRSRVDDDPMTVVHEVRFTQDRIHFPDSPSILPTTAIRDADHTSPPPEIRTRTGETLFISSVQATDLEHFCHRNQIPLQRRPDIWGDLLEPFLDTEFTAETQTATLSRLHTCGLTPSDVAEIRTKVAPMMRAYNAVHWDWVHLGLADLLDAATTPWIPETHRPTQADLPAFTAWAMKTADLATYP
jgi:hypothetical protein